MGNDASTRALILNLEELEAALRKIETSESDLSKHGWDAKDRSKNIEVFDSGIKVRRGAKANQSDAVRGRCLYQAGVHFFEFAWSGNDDSDKIVSIGVATQGADLTAKDRVLGSTDQSIAFDLVSQMIYFNGCPVKTYPANKPKGFTVPQKVTMILDMDNGTLGYKTSDGDYGQAMTGLRHMSEELCIAAELNAPWDEISVCYKGSSDEVKAEPVPLATPRASTRKSTRESDGGIRVPKTVDEFMAGLEETIKELKQKDIKRIEQAREMVDVYMLHAYSRIGSIKLKRLAGEKLSNIDGAKVITDYHNFLLAKAAGNPELKDFILVLRNVCLNYSHRSLLLCSKFGQSGLLDVLIKEIAGKSRTYTEEDMTKQLVISALAVLHNCSKASQNKPIYRKLRFVQEAKPYTHPDYHDRQVILCSLFAMSYVCEENESGDLIVGARVGQEIVKILSSAVNNGGRDDSGFYSYELAAGMSNLSVNPNNVLSLVKASAISPLVKMLDNEDIYEVECSLNAIWSLTVPHTKAKVSATDGLLAKIEKLAKSSNEVVKQSAIRLQMKLVVQQQKVGAGEKRSCQYADLCKRFKESLSLSKHFFDNTYDTCFCAECHGARGDKSKYPRGKPPKFYGMPVGWYKFGIKEPPRAEALDAFKIWHRAFHGTVKEALAGILKVGHISPAGRKVLGGKNIKERPGHFCDERKPGGFDTKQIFLSPSMRYSGIDTYAKPSRFVDKKLGKPFNAKVAFQVLIEPESYEVGAETIGARHEIDPDFSNQEMEWCTKTDGSHILTGLLVKLY